MKILQGQGVSKGVEHGPIYFCRRSQTLIQPDKADDPRFQGERLDRAMEQTAQQLGQMAELARAQAGDSAAQLFETHAMFLEDEDYTGAMEELLAEGYCAEYAVDQAGEQFSAMLRISARRWACCAWRAFRIWRVSWSGSKITWPVSPTM